MPVIKHELKVWPEFFKHLWNGEKTFELRKDDRGFRAGHLLDLLEWNEKDGYTGRKICAHITYILSGAGLQKGYVCLSLDILCKTD